MALERKVFALKEVARYLGIHPSSVYRMLKRGEITGYKIGSDWKFNLEAIEVYPSPAGLPVQYSGYLSPCGAILLWSRRD